MTCLEYLFDVFTAPGFSIWTTAAPSVRTPETLGASVTGSRFPCKH